MSGDALPEDGELRLGPVILPAGRRLTPEGHGQPVAWITGRDVPDPGEVWSALSDLHPQTGLVPFVVNEREDDYDDRFLDPCDVAEIDRLDVAELLAARWVSELDNDDDSPGFPGTPRATEFLGLNHRGEGGNSLFDIVASVIGAVHDPEADAELSRRSALDMQSPDWQAWAERSYRPEARRAAIPFPGVAPASEGSLSAAARMAALRALSPAKIGLAAASRPADVLATTGWIAFDDPAYEDGIRNAVWIGAILKSWETRFGARLLAVGPGAQIRLLVSRPPQTLETAEKIAAEHSAFCDECAGDGLSTVSEIAPALVDAPIWTFWWD